MASIRRGYSDDFTLNNNPSGFRKEASSSVGIGTSVGQEALDVVDGSVKGQDLKVTGISSFTAYEGFLRANHQIAENTTLSFDQGPVSSLSGEIIVGTGKTVTIDNLPDGEYGPELITNGSFISTTSGWTAYNAVISISNGQLKIDDTANAGSWSSAVQEVNTEPSVKYRLEVGIGTETEGSIYGIYNGRYPSAGTAPYDQSPRFDPGEDPAVGIVTDVYEFIATEKITSIILTANNDGIVHFDNVSLKKINVPEEPRAGGSEIECLKVFNTFTPPSGGTNERPPAPKPGELYYNYDFKTIEFFDGNGWRQVDNTTRSGRGVFAGGNPGVSPLNRTDSIDFIQVSTLGNSQNFGTLVSAKDAPGFGSVSNGSRGVFMSGWQTPAATNEIDYITIASEGNAVDFGNMNTAAAFHAACSSSTRGITMGGYPNTNDIQYIEIATTGNALDFGNMTAIFESNGGLASPTRGISAAGMSPASGASTATSSINVITIASKGDALIFGDLIQKKRGVGTVSSATRGIFAGGLDNPTNSTHLSSIEFITIASNGNGTDFGDLTLARRKPAGASNSTRGVFAYGYVAPALYNTMDYITIASTGDAQDFGDGSGPLRNGVGYCSDSHGGLGGF